MFYTLLILVAALSAVVTHALAFQSQEPLIDQDLPPILRVPLEEWQKLNDSIGGRLHYALPMAYPCYDNYDGLGKSVDPDACATIEQHKIDNEFVAGYGGGYILGNWGVCQSRDQGCQIPLNGTNLPNGTCWQGSVPRYYIDVQQVTDVQAGLALAQEYGFPVVVKNSGHDYKGRSSAPNSLSLWTHNHKPNITLTRNFIPDGCDSGIDDVVTFGAGQAWDGIYKFAESQNVTVAGGSASTVGAAGGWIAGGGHSPLSPVYGLGVDNVRQFRVVLPNGTYVTANTCQNQDIFFALRGGGGGTFGVVMEMSTRALPQLTIQYATFSIPNNDTGIYQSLLTVLVTQANRWASEGWGGYLNPINSRTPNHDILLLNPNISYPSALTSLSPLIDLANSLNVNWTLATYPSFFQAYTQDIQSGLAKTANYGAAMASRLIPSSNFATPANQNALISALAALPNGINNLHLSPMFLLVAPSAFTLPPSSPPASITPAWRSATWHVIVSAAWDPYYATPEQINNAFAAVHEAMQPLRELTPGSGAYQNEADSFEPDPVGAYWGAENYQKLLDIKGEVDQWNIMQVHQGVGWDPEAEGLWDCYPSDPNWLRDGL